MRCTKRYWKLLILIVFLRPKRKQRAVWCNLLDLHVNVDLFEIDEEHYVMKFKLPGSLWDIR